MTKKQWIILGTFILSGILSLWIFLGVTEWLIIANTDWEWEDET